MSVECSTLSAASTGSLCKAMHRNELQSPSKPYVFKKYKSKSLNYRHGDVSQAGSDLEEGDLIIDIPTSATPQPRIRRADDEQLKHRKVTMLATDGEIPPLDLTRHHKKRRLFSHVELPRWSPKPVEIRPANLVKEDAESTYADNWANLHLWVDVMEPQDDLKKLVKHKTTFDSNKHRSEVMRRKRVRQRKVANHSNELLASDDRNDERSRAASIKENLEALRDTAGPSSLDSKSLPHRSANRVFSHVDVPVYRGRSCTKTKDSRGKAEHTSKARKETSQLRRSYVKGIESCLVIIYAQL